ncbi:MAG: tetratricopeptide repeat protein [Caulobacterales bacterium]|jgi:cytochrome c-type biogenesis protein CcmH
MPSDVSIPFLMFFALAAVVTAAAAWWVLRAYQGASDGAGRPLRAVGACVVGAGLVLALYAVIGDPGRADAPYLRRMEALANKPLNEVTPEEAIALQEQRARSNPSDPLPYFLVGSIYEQFGELERAAIAYDQALRRAARVGADPATSADDRATLRLAQGAALTAIGRVRVAENQGQVPAQAVAMFVTAAELSPTDPEPWLYQAMAAAQAGEHQRAVALWDETLTRTPEDSPIRQMAQRLRARALAGEAPRAPPPMPQPG